MKEKVHAFYKSIKRLLYYLWREMRRFEDYSLKLLNYNLTLFII